jgi:hypothetical protein
MCIDRAGTQRCDELVAQHVCGIGESPENIFLRELRIGFQDVSRLHPIREAADEGPDRNASPTDTGFSMMEIIGHDDVVLPANAAHSATP